MGVEIAELLVEVVDDAIELAEVVETIDDDVEVELDVVVVVVL